MGTIKLIITCTKCKGTGISTHFVDGIEVEENPCSLCGGDGVRYRPEGLDDTLLMDILDKCNDILDKCNDILEAMQ